MFIYGRDQAKQDVGRLSNDGHTLELLDFGVEIKLESLSCRAPHDLDYHCQHMFLRRRPSWRNAKLSSPCTHLETSSLVHPFSVFSLSSPFFPITNLIDAVSA